jgi:plastocyanin
MRAGRLAIVAAAGAAVLAPAAAAPAGSAPAHRASGAVGVAEREFRISVYRPTLAPGTYRFNVTNFGEDAHNLIVRGPGGYSSATTVDIKAHETATLKATLRRAGVYRLICTKPLHRSLGMQAKVVVRPGHRR